MLTREIPPALRVSFWDGIGDFVMPVLPEQDRSNHTGLLTQEDRFSILKEICSHAFANATEDDKEPYFLYAIGTGEHVKIGVSNDVDYRLKVLQGGNHCRLELRKTWKLKDRPTAFRAEAAIHQRLSHCHQHLEWFKFDDELMKSMLISEFIFPGSLSNPFAPPTEECLRWWIYECFRSHGLFQET